MGYKVGHIAFLQGSRVSSLVNLEEGLGSAHEAESEHEAERISGKVQMLLYQTCDSVQ